MNFVVSERIPKSKRPNNSCVPCRQRPTGFFSDANVALDPDVRCVQGMPCGNPHHIKSVTSTNNHSFGANILENRISEETDHDQTMRSSDSILSSPDIPDASVDLENMFLNLLASGSSIPELEGDLFDVENQMPISTRSLQNY